jgi:signal transduction histidine kinase
MPASPSRRPFLSLGLRITVPIVLLVLGVAFGVYVVLVQHARTTLLDAKEAAATMVVKLTSASVMPAVVFGDDQEMQRAVRVLAQNPDVYDAELWGLEASALGASEGLLAQFHRGAATPLGRPQQVQGRRWRDAQSIFVVDPIVNLEGKPVAMLTVRFSTAREAATLNDLSRQIFYVGSATAACLALLILLAIHRVVVRPVKRLEEAAGRVARGEQQALDERVTVRARVEDEVVRLAERFGEMAEAVRDREARLEERRSELKLILDSVDQGFLTAAADGTLFQERSAIVDTWVGATPAGSKLWDILRPIDPSAEQWLRTGWEQLVDGILPLEVAIEQLPKRMNGQGRQFSLSYHPVLAGDALQRMVVVITDITSELARQRALAEQQEFAALVDQFVRDRRGFYAFWEEASALVSKLIQPSQDSGVSNVRRSLHTLKGNSRFFGLNRLSGLCHELESNMAERRDDTLTDAERGRLADLWNSLSQRIEPLMRGSTVFLEISSTEYDRLLDAVTRREPATRIEQLLRDLRHEPIAQRFEHARRVVEGSSRALGKAPPRVEIQHGDLRVPPGPWAPFWTIFSHVLSNAVDHGIEPDEERRVAGKPVPGSIELSISRSSSEIAIVVKDDGRGIDWEAVRQRAQERGLASQSPTDLKQALLADSFSTRSEVTHLSGRGVGLAAVNQVVTAMGGKIDVESTQAVGTTWRFTFPVGALTDSRTAGT